MVHIEGLAEQDALPDEQHLVIGISHTTCAGPPLASILFNCPSAKKAMKRSSGDQNGNIAPSVPASCRASSTSNARTASTFRPPPRAVTMNASFRPSGERVSD